VFETVRTAPPIGDLGLVYLVAGIIDRREARCRADGAVDVHHAPAGSADQVVMVVADAVFESRRRSRGLNAPEQTRGDQHAQGVVHRLQRDRANLRPDGLGHGVGRDVRLSSHRAQHRQPLGRHLNAAFSKKPRRVGHHGKSVREIEVLSESNI
jgi:hypothetical protein